MACRPRDKHVTPPASPIHDEAIELFNLEFAGNQQQTHRLPGLSIIVGSALGASMYVLLKS